MTEEAFRIGTIRDDTVLIEYAREHVVVFKAEGVTFDLQAGETVPGIADFVRNAKDFRLAWGKFQDDGDEVIYLYDGGSDNYGYAVNLDSPICSEWGVAPSKRSPDQQ